MKSRRIFMWILCAAITLAMAPIFLTVAGADAVGEGMWTTYRFANEYPNPDVEDEEIYKPEAGYRYTEEGFAVVPADYSATRPSMTVQTKTPQSVKDGVYLQFRIDDFSYDGGVNADEWITISLTDRAKVATGSTQYGGGWMVLIRGNGDGRLNQILPCLTAPQTEEDAGTFFFPGVSGQGTVPLDEEGREIYTLEITWDGSAYEMKLNGTVISGAKESTELLEKLNSDGEFFVGINMQSAVKNGTAALTVLKYGTSEATATVPQGTDSKEPEENELNLAPIADPDTVPMNTPAILWDPSTYELKAGNNVDFTPTENDGWQATVTDSVMFFNLKPKAEWSYDATDFPVVGIMFRDLWVDAGHLWYSAGEYDGATYGFNLPFSIYDGLFYGEDEEYIFVPIDLLDLWEGRINNIRLDMSFSDPDVREFNLCFVGMFRSTEEAYAYAEDYLEERQVICGHQYETQVTEPTCLEWGYTTYTCVLCGDSFRGDYVESLEHDFTAEVIEPACDEWGYTLFTCSLCGYEYDDEYVHPLDHDYVEEVILPTCTEWGYTLHACSRCNETYRDSYVANPGHTPGSAADCTHEQACQVCGTVIQNALGHQYAETVTAPTCTEQGFTTHVCERCEHSYVDGHVSALGHTPGKEADCTRGQLCETCGEVLQNARGHEYIEQVTKPSCTEQGFTTKTCTACGETEKSAFQPATGHTPGSAASCVADQICTSCGCILQNAFGHNYTSKTIAPTCVEKGYTEHLCTRCEDAYRDTEIAAKGHTASDWIVDAEPAVGVPGERHKKCTVCGENLESETIPALEEQTTLEPDSVDTPDEPVVTDEVTKEDTPVPGTTEPETTESELNSGSAGCAGALGLGEMTLFMILAAACLITRKRSKE